MYHGIRSGSVSKGAAKWLLIAIAVFMTLFFGVLVASAEENLNFTGWVQGTYLESTNEADVPRARVKGDYQSESCLGWQVELDVAAATDGVDDLENSNFIQRAFVRCKTEDGTWSVGRIFLSAGWATPAPFLIRTVNYPGNFPFGILGYGVQYERTIGHWTLMADLAGNSARRFHDSADLNFDRVEGSTWIKRSFGSTSLGFAAQVSDQFVRAGITGELNEGPWFGLANVSYTDNDHFTGLGLVEYRINDWLASHVQYEELDQSRWTAGIGIGMLDSIYLVVDVIDVGGEEELGTRLQLRF